jgi:hypothetical protein
MVFMRRRGGLGAAKLQHAGPPFFTGRSKTFTFGRPFCMNGRPLALDRLLPLSEHLRECLGRVWCHFNNGGGLWLQWRGFDEGLELRNFQLESRDCTLRNRMLGQQRTRKFQCRLE